MNETIPADAPAFDLDQLDAVGAAAERYRTDEALRARLASRAAPEALAELGLDAPANVAVRVAENTGDVVHFVFPPDPNAALEDESLSAVSGGLPASTASSASSVGCLPSTVSTGGTASSIRPSA